MLQQSAGVEVLQLAAQSELFGAEGMLPEPRLCCSQRRKISPRAQQHRRLATRNGAAQTGGKQCSQNVGIFQREKKKRY